MPTEPASWIIPAANVTYELASPVTSCEFDFSDLISADDRATDTTLALTVLATSPADSVYVELPPAF